MFLGFFDEVWLIRLPAFAKKLLFADHASTLTSMHQIDFSDSYIDLNDLL